VASTGEIDPTSLALQRWNSFFPNSQSQVDAVLSSLFPGCQPLRNFCAPINRLSRRALNCIGAYQCVMQSKKESKKPQVMPLLQCPSRSICKTTSVEFLAIILSKALRNPIQKSFSFSPVNLFCSAESVFAFCEAVHADCRIGRYHNHIQSLEFKRMDLEDSVMHKIAIAANCLSLQNVSFYGCRMSPEGAVILGEFWHNKEFLHLKQISFEECDNLPTDERVRFQNRSSCNIEAIITKFLPQPSQEAKGSHMSFVAPEIEHVSFCNTLLCKSSKLHLAMSLPALKNLVSLDLSGTGEWIGKTAFLLGQCISALPNMTTWRFDCVDLCQTRPNVGDTQRPPVADSHMILLGLRMKVQSEFSSVMFQEDWTYLYQKKEIFHSSVMHISLSHSCITPGVGSMALSSILNCFPNLRSVDLSSSLISHSLAHRVFNQIHIRCPKLRKADFSGCSGWCPS
jgi:hypothetical protein